VENAYAQDLRGIFGWNRTFTTATAGNELLELMHAAEVIEPFQHEWRSRVRVASLDSLLFIHSAFPTTAADAVFFGPDTYRFISALNLHLAHRVAPIRRVVDIGCGAGPGAVIAANALPHAEVFAVDINQAALATTYVNACAAGVANVTPLFSNLLDDLAGEFDLIIANPPYLLDPAGRTYRHGGGDLGAGLSVAIVEAAISRLSPGGSLLLYTGIAIRNGIDPFLATVKTLLPRSFTWHYYEIDPDIFSEELLESSYQSIDRIAAVILEITKIQK
jgi:methylase of polypeptide subunit release factors